MKFLVGAYKRVNTDNEPYKMCIIETSEIQDEVQPKSKTWCERCARSHEMDERSY